MFQVNADFRIEAPYDQIKKYNRATRPKVAIGAIIAMCWLLSWPVGPCSFHSPERRPMDTACANLRRMGNSALKNVDDRYYPGEEHAPVREAA